MWRTYSGREKSTVGSMVRVHAECMAGHVDSWHSQPVINQQPVGNILLSAAILLSGGLFSTFYLFASLLNFAFIGKSTFYELQHRILWPVIDKAWHDHVGVVQMLAQGRALRLCGDARCDSPGYSATYGTYTLMDMLDGLICATATGIQKCSARSGHHVSTTLPTSIHRLAMRSFISVNTVCYQMQIKLLGLTVLVLRRKPCKRLCSTSNFWMTLGPLGPKVCQLLIPWYDGSNTSGCPPS